MHTTLRSVALASICLAGLTGCLSSSAGDGSELATDRVAEEEAARRIDQIQFMRGLELVHNLEQLARMGDAAGPQLVAALKAEDGLTRGSVAWVFGVLGDRRFISDVHGLLADPVAGVRYEGAATLVKLGDPRGFPVLIEGLADGDVAQRYKCAETLTNATGQDFGYRHDDGPQTRRLAVERWVQWLDGLRASGL